jgi:ribosomal protein L21E
VKPENEDAAFQIGDQVKLVLDKERSPDNHLHGQTGEITDIQFDQLEDVTGNPQDNFLYTVKLNSGKELDIHFRRHDLKKTD